MFLKNYPAMKIKDWLVVADLHLGIVKDIYDKGIFVPSQAASMAEKINKLGKLSRTKKLVLLGDVKHKVPGFSLHEKYELVKFFDMLNFKSIVITKGNHDGIIEVMIPPTAKKKVKVRDTFTIGEYLLTHGHMNIKTTKKKIVVGHNQPHVRMRDDMGAYYTEPVWVRGRLKGKLDGKNLIIVPAFNELCGATIVNKDALLGPIAKMLDTDKTKLYLIDGTDIGWLKDFMPKQGIRHKVKLKAAG